MGMPFQWRTSTPETNVGCEKFGDDGEKFPNAAFKECFDPERQNGGRPAKRIGQEIIGVQVAKRGEDVGHFRMKRELAWELLEPMSEQAQTLQRIHRVHRTRKS